MAYLKSNKYDEFSQQLIEQQISKELANDHISDPALQERLEMRLQKIREMIAEEYAAPVVSMHPEKLHRFGWSRIAAAVIIALVIGAGTYFFVNQRQHNKEIAKTNSSIKNDVAAPSSTHAVIILANGKQIVLDSAGNGSLAMQGNVNIQKLADGQIAYKGNSEEVVYNTLSNPKGSKVVSLTLSDGTTVWLNAGSSLTYPTAFGGNERKVQITGEAYFEVAHNVAMPFTVTKGDAEVTVLGTHFNINAYDDEAEMKITLLEGSVRVHKGNATGLLKPGQQAIVAPTDHEKIKVVNVNVEEVMAWKNGLFSFNKADLQTVLRQLNKWYNVEVVYHGKIPKQLFGGDIQRTLSLAQVLKILEKSEVHFKIEDNKIIVMP